MSEWSDIAAVCAAAYAHHTALGYHDDAEESARSHACHLRAIERARRVLDVAEGYALPGDEADRVRRAAELAEAYS